MAIPKIDDQDINTMPRCDIEELKIQVKHLKDLLKECKNYIETEQKMLVECSPFWEKLMNNLLSKIDNAIGASKND